MVVHENVHQSPPTPTRRSKRNSKRRSSQGPERRRVAPSVHQALFYLIAALEPYRSDTYSQRAADALLSYTSAHRRRLGDEDILLLEDAVNAVEHSVDHLFMPWVSGVHLTNADAGSYLDTPFLVDVLLDLERRENARLDPVTRTHARRATSAFLKLLGVSRRRRTI